MIPRPAPLTIPATPRYWTVDLDGKGQHHFKMPTYSTIEALAEVLVDRLHLAGEDGKVNLHNVARQAHVMALLLGACWHHRALALEAVAPGADASPDAWVAYGVAVEEELVERGYDLLEITGLFNAVMPRVNEALDFARLVKGREGFLADPPASSTGSP